MKSARRIIAKHWLDISIVILLFVELDMLTFFQNVMGPHASPVILLVSGLLAGILFIRYGNQTRLDTSPGSRGIVGWVVAAGIICVLAVIFGYMMMPGFAKYPFENPQTASGSDIIPQIQILVQRWLSGEFPYQSILPDNWSWGHTLYPTYLPMTWMPFIVAEKIGLDYRWFAFLCLVGAFFYSLFSARPKLSSLSLTLLSLLPFVILYLFLQHRPGIFSLTVESLIVAYYLCFAISLLSSSALARGIFLMLCLLSRYSIVLWVPLLFLVLWQNEERRKSLLILGVLFLGFVLIYYIPYLMEDPMIFKNGYDYHSKAAVDLWQPRSWQAEGDTPDNLLKGLGFGVYFYEWFDMDIAGKLKMYKLAHLIFSIASVAGLGVYYLKNKANINYRLFLLGSLKIYLVVFYNFIQIPFHYLYLVPVFVSVPMIGVILSRRNVA
jgi:hypothetical protein